MSSDILLALKAREWALTSLICVQSMDLSSPICELSFESCVMLLQDQCLAAATKFHNVLALLFAPLSLNAFTLTQAVRCLSFMDLQTF